MPGYLRGGAALLVLAAVAFAAASSGLAAAHGLQGSDALHALFGDSGRRLLSSTLSYETVWIVSHPLRSDMSQKKVQQSHAGLELFGHTFVVGLAADGVTEQAEGTYGTIFPDLDQALPDVTPTLTTFAAANIAQSLFDSITVVSTRLVIWVEKEHSNSVHLAYVVTMVGSSALPAYALVDAKDGQVLRSWSEQRTQHAPRPRQQDSSTQAAKTRLDPAITQTQPQATATSARAGDSHVRRGLRQSRSKYVDIWAIGGNEKVGRIYYNGTNGQPQLQVTKSGNNCFLANRVSKTGDLLQLIPPKGWDPINYFRVVAGIAWKNKNLSEVHEHYQSLPAVGYLCPKQGTYLQTTDAVKGSYSQQADVQALMSLVINMWKEWMGLDVISVFKKAGVPTPILVIPHAAPDYENAFWSDWFFACGDGNATVYPLCTAGDVLAHELGHGITQIVNGGLLYYGQAGAWNEGFSDMIGMTFNFYHSGVVDPMTAAAITRHAPGARNMSNPGQFNQSSSALNLTSGDPHVLSGIPNHAFYLLATSPCYDPKVAMQVVQRAAHLYFTPTTSFLEGANAWARAAKDLGYDAAPVLEAWEAVGLWQACGSKVDRVYSASFYNPAVPEAAPTKAKLSFNASANASVYVGKTRWDKISGTNLQPCGLTIYLVSYDSADAASRPNVYVGVDRMPLPSAGVWDCKVDMEVSPAGPTQPGCDVPATPNATVYVVLHSSSHDWKNQGVSWQSWGPRVGGNGAGEAPAAPKCFNGGACTADSECASGNCLFGRCYRKPSGR